MLDFEEMIAQREKEAREFARKYKNAPEKLAADLAKAIETIEAKGYIVRSYENREFGRLNEEQPVAYEIMHSDYSTVYGYGTCDAEQVMRFAKDHCSSTDETDGATAETTGTILDAQRRIANQKKEREYDLIYNEGAEGYNPYRLGSAPTYNPRGGVTR